MYNLIVIDDDEFSLQMLSQLTCWEEMGFTLKKAFSDSECALKYIAENPDINLVFSDIKMPKKDGIEIAEFCNSLEKPPYVVFVSAYSDFDYAIKALRFNVTDYLTKPFSVSQITEILKKVKTRLDKENLAFSTPSLTVNQQLFFFELLNGEPLALAELKEKMVEVGINTDFISCKTYVLDIVPNDLKKYLTYTWKHGRERFYSAFSYLINSDNKYFSSVVSFREDLFKVILISQDNSDISDFVEEFRQNISEILKLDCEISIEKEYETFGDIVKDNSVSSDKNAISYAISYISENYEKDITLETVANYVSLSKVYFSSLFKNTTGENFTDFLNRIRIEKAIDLIKNTDRKISSIAAQVGYQSIPHFYKTFSKYTGYTPVKFKEALNEKSDT